MKLFNRLQYKYTANTILRISVIVVISVTSFSCNIFIKNKNVKNEDPRIKKFNFNYYFLEGNKQKALGNFDEALKQYSLANGVDETQAAVCYEIAGILNMSGDYAGAVEYAEKAIKIDKTKNVYYSLLLAFVYQNNNQFDKAAVIYKDLIKRSPEKISYYFELSEIYMQQNKLKEAISVLDKAESYFGITEMISLEKESYYVKSGKSEDAIREIKKLVDNYPLNMKYATLLAETYVNAGRYDEAENVYNSINEDKVDDGIVFFSMADFYRTRQNYEKAFKYLAIGIKRNDVVLDIKIRVLLQLLEIVGNDDYIIGNMRYLFELMAENYPDELKVRALNSDFLLFTKEYKKAQNEFDFLLDHDKSKFQIWEQALQVDFILQDMQSMYRRSKEAIELFPNVIELYRYFIVSAYATENFIEVTKSVDYIADILVNDQPLLIEFMMLQGDSYHKLNMHHKSDSVYESILDIDAENLSVLNNYSYFLAERGEKLEMALDLSKKLVELDGENPVYLDTHAWVLFKNKEYKTALTYMQKAIEIDSKSFVYYDHLGDIQFKLDMIDSAIESWYKSIELGNISESIKKKIEYKNIEIE